MTSQNLGSPQCLLNGWWLHQGRAFSHFFLYAFPKVSFLSPLGVSVSGRILMVILERFPEGFFAIPEDLFSTFLKLSLKGFPEGFLYFPEGFSQDSERFLFIVSWGFLSHFLRVSQRFPEGFCCTSWGFLSYFLRVCFVFPEGFFYFSEGFSTPQLDLNGLHCVWDFPEGW